MTGAAKSAKTSQSRHRASFVDRSGVPRLVEVDDLAKPGYMIQTPGATELPSAIPRLGQS